ncbi:helix-turn-helix transcriptional regulator [Rhodobaculum claviforme]|uniref:Transcriptional regulator, AlpA family n=1 Tax=Rhodobaculum claviforme TaxID=1549854 RepID=A0A934TKF7_9RHOB|nr:hypothetical protein [Rhodobaculum claviforme]MBK5926862.1 hypothetical protein [Rhodobaculum claviforme]
MGKRLNFRDFREQYLGGRSRGAVYNDIAAGRLPAPLKLGGTLFFDIDEVEAHLVRLREQQEQERALRAEADAIAAARRAERAARKA